MRSFRLLLFLLCLAFAGAEAQTSLKLSDIIPGTENVQLVYNGDFQFQGPTANGEPGDGVQVVLTGACPFDTIGALKVTGVAPPSTDCAVCAAGQLIFGGSGVIGTGVGTWVGVVVPPHATETIAPATARTRRSPHLHTKTH